MDELITWLRTQLDHDEGLARMAFAEHNQAIAEWNEPWSGTVEIGPHEDDLICNDSGVSRHIVNWDPARVLAEIEAKRKLLDLHWPDTSRYVQPQCHECSSCGCCSVDHPCDTIKVLAQPYAAAREGWRDEWALTSDS